MVNNPYIVISFHLSWVWTRLYILLVILMLWLFLFSIICWCILVVHTTLSLILSISFYMLDSSLSLGVLCDCVVHVLVVQVVLAVWTNVEILCTLLVWYYKLLLLLTPLNLSKSINQIWLLWDCCCVPISNDPVVFWYHPWLSCNHSIVCLS